MIQNQRIITILFIFITGILSITGCDKPVMVSEGIISVSPPTEDAIFKDMGESQEFKIELLNPSNKDYGITWRVSGRDSTFEWPERDEEAKEFELTINPEGENNKIWVTCYLMEYQVVDRTLIGWPTYDWVMVDKRKWMVITSQTPPTWNNDYYVENYNDINRLEGFTEISGELNIIARHPDVKVLDEPSDLTKVGSLLVSSNASLKNLQFLKNLSTVDEDIIIRYNESLETLEGLENIISVSDDVYIHDNGALISLKGLDNLESANDLTISGNSYLSNLELTNLHTVGNSFRIEENPALCQILAEELWEQVTDLEGNDVNKTIQSNKDCQ